MSKRFEAPAGRENRIGLTYLRVHFIFIDKIWINKDRYDRKRLFRKAGQGKAN
jgi:hypothetical protein